MNLKDLLLPAKATIVSVSVKWLMGLLVSKASFFALGPINWIFVRLLTFSVSWLYDWGVKESESQMNVWQKEQLAQTINYLIAKYDTALPEEKEKIEDEIIDNSRDLIKLLKHRPTS